MATYLSLQNGDAPTSLFMDNKMSLLQYAFMIKKNISYSIEMQELSITYPTRTQIKKEEGKKIKEGYSFHAVYARVCMCVCSILSCVCVHVQFFPTSF